MRDPAPILAPVLHRRAFLGLLTVSTTLALAPGEALAAGDLTYDELFFIQRSKNANEVHYAARVTRAGRLDGHDPVVGYWINKAEDGSRQGLSFFQRMAYGYDVEDGGDGTYRMTLKAFPDRPLRIVKARGHWRLRTTIGGKPAYMTKLYVATDESGMIPKVLYVDAFGEEVAGGAPIHEHIVRR